MDYFEYLRSIRESNLSTKARIVALIIASYNPSRPTNKQIAEGTGLCERTVRSAKKELVESGYLRQIRTFNAANHYKPTVVDAVGYGKTLPSKYKLNTNINTKEIQEDSNESLVVNILTSEEVESLLSW
ncbi:Helix-turn-helix domain containing protein [uncultured Caudovirales phage]|uniref:Helix-turn-helix domain containing protein n=1 Tax=uncultured Caudovirales phage TaxID=2100421 RepID=A0A6J5NRT2_9CAUD|nr:Helix-turn-helix domain containing protein [uncultured Caudovirales phage]